MSDGELILVAGALMIAGLAASLAAERLRLPGLVLFLGLGMAIGSDGAGWIDFTDYELARTIGVVALALPALSVAALAYGGAAALHGSGFLSVYLVGVALGSVPIPAERAVSIFHQGLAGLAQVTMFLVLGLLVFPSQLWGVALEGTVLALVLVFLARPVAAFAATAATGLGLHERVVLAWGGLRGAVPVVLATFPVIAAVSHSLEFFNIVFFAVLLSTLLQGPTFEPLANRLDVTVAPYVDPARRPSLGRLRSIARISTSKPWDPSDGNPGHPRQVSGVGVAIQLLTRIDQPGSLVRLEDGRYAFCGKTVSVGSATSLQAAARRRLVASASDAERAWWREIIGALARGSD